MSKKPRPPEPVPPVIADGIRYEAPFAGTTVGIAQDGGVVAAYREETGELLWAVSVYAPDEDVEDENGDVFITEMVADESRGVLTIKNQMGNLYELDLNTRAVRRVRVGPD